MSARSKRPARRVGIDASGKVDGDGAGRAGAGGWRARPISPVAMSDWIRCGPCRVPVANIARSGEQGRPTTSASVSSRARAGSAERDERLRATGTPITRVPVTNPPLRMRWPAARVPDRADRARGAPLLAHHPAEPPRHRGRCCRLRGPAKAGDVPRPEITGRRTPARRTSRTHGTTSRPAPTPTPSASPRRNPSDRRSPASGCPPWGGRSAGASRARTG